MAQEEHKEIAFFGKMTAASTHEMKNVLAIIKESSGLMEDLMALSRDIPMNQREKLLNTLSVIKKQIERGTELSNRLNQFAHSTDAQVDKVDLQAAAQLIVTLAQRFARLKNVVLTAEASTVPTDVLVRPVLLLTTLFGCIECCLENVPSGSEIRIGVEKTDRGSEVSVLCATAASHQPSLRQALAADSQRPVLERMAESLGGHIELDADIACIRLHLPQTPA